MFSDPTSFSRDHRGMFRGTCHHSGYKNGPHVLPVYPPFFVSGEKTTPPDRNSR